MILTHEGIRLHAKLELPESEAERHPLVIVVHGFTGHMEEPHILAVSRMMNRIGFATLRLELYGHGQSGGSFRDHDLNKWTQEIVSVIDRMKQLDFVSKLYLCGHSQGGLAILLAAAQRPRDLAGLIPLSPAWKIPNWAREGEVLRMRFDPSSIPQEISLGEGLCLGGNYLRVAQSIDAEAALKSYDGPVLIVHGTADATVPYACSQEAAALMKNCSLIPVEGDTHCFDLHPEQMVRAVEEWLLRR